MDCLNKVFFFSFVWRRKFLGKKRREEEFYFSQAKKGEKGMGEEMEENGSDFFFPGESEGKGVELHLFRGSKIESGTGWRMRLRRSLDCLWSWVLIEVGVGVGVGVGVKGHLRGNGLQWQ